MCNSAGSSRPLDGCEFRSRGESVQAKGKRDTITAADEAELLIKEELRR